MPFGAVDLKTKRMKKSYFRLFVATGAVACLSLSSCSEEESNPQEQPPAAPSEQTPPPPAVPEIAADVLKDAVLPAELKNAAWLEVQDVTLDLLKDREADCYGVIVLLRVKENLCGKTEAPAELNEERKAVNPMLNKAMTPESVYLLQAGADPATIGDADRKAKPLPSELREKAEILVHLADPDLWKTVVPAGETTELHGAVRITVSADAAPAFSDVTLDTTPIEEWGKLMPASALPGDAALLTPEWLQQRKQEMQTAMEDFNTASAPYIKGREDAARTRLLEEQARAEEERKKCELAENEAREKAAAERKLYTQVSAAGSVYQGEWAKDEQTGKLKLTILTAETLENSVALTAELTDPDLPQVSLELQGRCLLAPEEGEKDRLQMGILDGLYDPDVAPAKIYDAKDGVLLLNMTDQGTLQGVLTCKSWDVAQKTQDVKVILRPITKEKKKK